MKKLSTYLWEHKWKLFFAVIALVISVVLDMVSPQLTMRIIDDVIGNGERDQLVWLLMGIAIVSLGRCIFQYLKEYNFDRMGSSVASGMRKDLFHHIQGLSADFFDRNNTGELMARVKDDVDKVWGALTFVGMLLVQVFLHTAIVLYCMYSLNWKLAIAPTIAMLISAGLALLLDRKVGPTFGRISEENAKLNDVAEENLAGVRTVKAFAREKHEIAKFAKRNEAYYVANMENTMVFVKYYPYFQVITKLLPILILLMGGGMVINDEMSLGKLGAFLAYSMNIIWPMEMLGWLTNEMASAVASIKKIRKIYSEKPSIVETEEPVRLEEVKGQIQFDHVSFWKEDRYKILEDVSFKVEAGKTIGIMGATGAGKTSIVNLLLRLYDTSEGRVLLDGVDVRELTLEQLRSSISLVMQDVFLFSDTINENIRLGKRESLDMGTVMYSAKQAQASEFIEKMDKQYETVIGERGVGLSGGQKQRISIARALAKNNPILVLDDSTSALDMETEHLVQKTLETLSDTTKIIIAHRISAVCKADHIIVLDSGKIVEMGTHKELLAQKGLYYETYIVQYAGRKEA